MSRRSNSTTTPHAKPTMWRSQKPMETAKWPWRLANRRAAMLKRRVGTRRKPTTRRRARMPGPAPKWRCSRSNAAPRRYSELEGEVKAVRLYEYGGAENLKYEDKVPEPALSDDAVLVENSATSVNPVDWKVGSG